MKTEISGVCLEECSYRCEGNSSIVVWDRKRRRVYRIPKTTCTRNNQGIQQRPSPYSRAMECLEYTHNIMLPLLGHCYIPKQGIVEVTPDQLKRLESSVESYRPKLRLVTHADTSQPSVQYMDDCCFIQDPLYQTSNPTWAVEIKPKWGALPEESTTCYFCMLQKLKEGKGCRSKYCPLDLFSGDKVRMKHAFESLMKTPLNNLRIFKDGELLWCQDNQSDLKSLVTKSFRCQDEFIEVVLQALLHAPKCARNQSDTNGLVRQPSGSASHLRVKQNNQCHEGDSCLPSGCVLQKVLSAQQLDDLGTANVHKLYQAVIPTGRLLPLENSSSSNPPASSNLDSREKNTDLHLALQKIQQYLISRTARDCSILIAIQKVSDSDPQTSTTSPSQCFLISLGKQDKYQVSVSVVDLDPKSPHKIPTYYREEVKARQLSARVTQEPTPVGTNC